MNTHVPTTCSFLPSIFAVSLSHFSNVHVPLFTSSFTALKSFGDGTSVPSANFSFASGVCFNTSSGSVFGVPSAFDGWNS